MVKRLNYDEHARGAQKDRYGTNEPSQQAEDVFARRTGVCEGYARLMVALGKAADVEIAFVTGSIRDARRRLADGDDASIEAALEGLATRGTR